MTHGQILKEAKEKGIKKIYTWLEAISIVRKAILSGEVDIKGKGILVYFQVAGNSTSYRFYAVCHDDGQLKVHVRKVRSDLEWGAADGAAFSN